MKGKIKTLKLLLQGVKYIWWREVDSNHRRLRQQIYSLPPLATREPLHILIFNVNFLLILSYGAGDGTRTRNLLITNQLLCQLSYTSMSDPSIYPIYSL
jgi:hypothetical protein